MSKETKSCDCNFEDDGGICAVCDKSFDNLSQFIRHVTHDKMCKANYDPELIEHFKKKSRKLTKQKWYHNQAHGPKSKSFKEKRAKYRKENPKMYYIPKRIKETECAQAFGTIFGQFYNKYEDEARMIVEKQSIEQEYLVQEAFEEALDKTFEEHEVHNRCLDLSLDIRSAEKWWFTEDEESLLVALFIRMEKFFKEKFENLTKEKQRTWKDRKLRDLCLWGLYNFVKNKAFVEGIYDRWFKDLYEKAYDNALDVMFFFLITTEGYFEYDETKRSHLELQMHSAFPKVLDGEIKKLFEANDELKNALVTLVQKEFTKKFKNCHLQYESNVCSHNQQ